MLKALIALVSQAELRRWALWKFRHPFDRGRRLHRSHPPYLPSANPIHEKPESTGTLPRLNPVEKFSAREFSFTLAGVTVPARDRLETDLEQLWSKKFDDLEDAFAAHRFGWIFALASANSYEEREKAAGKSIECWRQWSSTFPNEAWHPYTISERLANWGLFLCRSRISLDLTEVVSEEAQKLLVSLEHYDDDLTGNHLLNNARGLLWAALMTNSTVFKSAGALIAEHEVDRLVSTDGFLREGSSHYQLLVTRNCFEIYWLASRLKIESIAKKYAELLPKMASSCRVFDLQGHHAAIGDLSPDAPPDWFIDVPDVIEDFMNPGSHPKRSTRGWARHFKSEASASMASAAKCNEEFARIDSDGFSVIAHVSPLGSPRLPGHGHCDALSFVAVHEGQALVIDRGRRSYRLEDQISISSCFHNGITIDDQEIEFIARGIFGPGYIENRRGPRPALTVLSPAEIKIDHHGFRHLGVAVNRRLKIEKSHLKVTTELEGQGERDLVMFLHSPIDSGVRVKWPGDGHVTEFVGSQSDKSLGTLSSSYGDQSECRSFKWTAKVKLPWTGVIEIHPK